MTMLNQHTTDQVKAIIAELQHKPGNLLPILHGIQNCLGYIPPDAVGIISESLNQSRAEIHGVISFYHQFRNTPPGKHTIQICRAEACQSMGSRTLESHVKSSLNIDYHQTTADKEISLEAVYCLGNCACSPSIRVNDEVIGRVTTEKFDQLITELTTQTLEVV